jgi:hypothetical protein
MVNLVHRHLDDLLGCRLDYLLQRGLDHLAFVLEGIHLLIGVIPGQGGGLHLHLLLVAQRLVVLAHLLDRCPVGDLAARPGYGFAGAGAGGALVVKWLVFTAALVAVFYRLWPG